MERRLAAILAADVVGYSRLMELDEVGTLALARARAWPICLPHGQLILYDRWYPRS